MAYKQIQWPDAIAIEDLPEGTKFESIPQPPEHLFGFLGNLPDIDPSFQFRSFWKLQQLYGDIYSLNTLRTKTLIVSNYEFARQTGNEELFEKALQLPLRNLRVVIADGLFSAYSHEKNWGKAHRLLMPVFGPLGIKKMFSQMLDIASQMILKWDRAGPENRIDTSEDFTRLAFDTIGLCSFNYRFNQFYKESVHPFAGQMANVMTIAQAKGNRTSIENTLRIFTNASMDHDVKEMQNLVDEIIAERKKNPQPEVNDLLNVMLGAVDQVTGEKLSDENIRANMITFLIAGHETTSGTLAFLFYMLLKHPEALLKAQKEVDAVLGDDPIELKHISQLKYVDACIKETLRLNGPIGGYMRKPKKDVAMSGKYLVKADTVIVTLTKGLHTDPKVWGDDADKFKPERMLKGDYPEGAWRPFGTGMRGCIGRFFAEQEMLINVALILQRFQVEQADPNYDLKLKSTLTIKPDGFAIKVRRRPGKSLIVGLSGAGRSKAKETHHTDANEEKGQAKKKLVVAYGSNAGTCKTLAEDLQSVAPEFGLDAQVCSLDALTEDVPKNVPTVLITSSYEGLPPDNAKKFVTWLESNADKADALKDVHFALFGVGNSEWSASYQKVPKTVESLMLKQGARPLCDSCFSNVKEDTLGSWEKFTAALEAAIKTQGQGGDVEHKMKLEAKVIRHDVPVTLEGEEHSMGIVKSVRSLGGAEVGPEKREIEIQLPENVVYQSGDYLSIVPDNHPDVVARALKRFDLHENDLINVTNTRKVFLQTSQPVAAKTLFTQRVELGTTATQRQIETLAKYTPDDGERTALTSLASDKIFQSAVIAKNYSLLDILDDHPFVKLPLSAYLDMLKPLAPRLYSIASSTLAQNDTHDSLPISSRSKSKSSSGNNNIDDASAGSSWFSATLVYDVHAAAARSGHYRRYHGVASSHLASLRPGDRVRCGVRATNAAFHLPPDPATPVIFIAAGTGIAPMRGFVQERAAVAAAGAKALGPALLYFGCRDYQADNLYADELDRWQARGAVDVRRAFSRRGPPPPPSDAGSDAAPKYVYERIWADKEEVADLFAKGCKIFLCGSAGKLAKSTADVLKKIYLEKNPGKSDEEADTWLQSIKETRYVTDVFD